MESLKSWNKRTTDKTYADFKIHLCKEYNELRQVGALSIKKSNLQPQINMASNTENISNAISASVTNDLRNTIMDAIMALNQHEDSVQEPTAPKANSATVPIDSVVQLAQLVKDLQQEVRVLKSKEFTPVAKNCNPKTGKPWRHYCHTHGCCDHWGRNCKDKT